MSAEPELGSWPEVAKAQRAVIARARQLVSRPTPGTEWRDGVTNEDYQRLHGAVLKLDGLLHDPHQLLREVLADYDRDNPDAFSATIPHDLALRIRRALEIHDGRATNA